MRALCVLLFFCTSAFAYGPITCPTPQPSDVVIIVAGQSNAGSYGDVAYNPSNSDVQLYFGNGLCYPLVDALAGFPAPPMPGSGGSIWSRFSYLLHTAHPGVGRLILVNIAENGVPIANWAQGGQDYPRIAMAVNALAAHGWNNVKAFLFMDGESDAIAGLSGSQATAAINSMVSGSRANGYTFPFFIGINSTCRFTSAGVDAGIDFDLLSLTQAATRMKQQSAIQVAQFAIGNPSQGIYIGANTDLISAYHRWDHCHLSNYGQWIAAQMWLNVLGEILP